MKHLFIFLSLFIFSFSPALATNHNNSDLTQSSYADIETHDGSKDRLWAEATSFLSSGRAVSEGHGKRIFVFTESTCPYSNKFFQEVHTDPNILKNVEIVWVPVTRDGKNFRTGDILNGSLDILKDKNKTVNVSRKQESMVYDNALFLQEKGGRLSVPSALVLGNDGIARFHYEIDTKWLRKTMTE